MIWNIFCYGKSVLIFEIVLTALILAYFLYAIDSPSHPATLICILAWIFIIIAIGIDIYLFFMFKDDTNCIK